MTVGPTAGNRKARRKADALARKTAVQRNESRNTGQPNAASCTVRPQWRSALLGTAAAGALALAQPSDVRAQAVVNAPGTGTCTTVGLTATCTGDLSNGVTATGPAIDTLNVNGLTGNIGPAAGIDGINFGLPGNGDITINSTTGAFQIITTGNADGIAADIGNDGDITINSTGNIQAGGRGIRAEVNDDGNITIVSTGDIRSVLEGIEADVNDNGDISIQSTGNITTTGNGGHGISAYAYTGVISVTSTGNVTTNGNYADAIGAYAYYGSVNIQSNGVVTTRGDYSRGIYAYGYDGNVSVTSSGNISTAGRYAFGIHVNGAGTGSTSVNSTSDISTTGYNAYGIFVNRNGPGDVSITSSGNISTTGTYADGIFGNHAGPGNLSITSTGDVSTRGFRAFGLSAYNAGGNVTVTSTGDISTTGALGYGISAGVAANESMTIMSSGDITTTGAGADGITAYSGGGAVRITASGDVNTTGRNSDAIDVNNAVGVGNSTVRIAAGTTITGGSAGGDGIDFQDGNINRVVNFGTITTRGENAIEGEGSGSEQIHNFGTVTGNVHLGAGSNAFSNKAGGLFNAGRIANLGAGNRLTNAGTLSPGGEASIQRTELTGTLLQTNTGTFAVDINLGNATSDRLNATGTARLAGDVKVTVQNPAQLNRRFTILSAAGGTTDNGLSLAATSPALNAQLLFPNATDVVLGIRIDFATTGLNRNQTSIGNNLNAALAAGGGTLGPIYNALLNGITTLPDYANALDQLSPEIYLNTETATLFASEEFTNNLFSCQSAGSRNAAIKEGQCLWVRPEGRFLRRDRTDQHIGFKEDVGSFSAGAQVAVAPGWFAGGGIGFETASLKTDTGADSESNRFSIGGALKYQSGPVLLAAAISGGISDFETHRPMNFGGFSATAGSQHDIKYVAGQLRAAYLLPLSNWYAKPLVDLNLTHLDRDAIAEVGAGAAKLLVAGGDNTFFSVTPALELGGEFAMAAGSMLRPFIRAGVAFYSDGEHTLTAQFAGSPNGVGAFAISTQFDDVFADIEAGVSLMTIGGANLTMSYEGRISDKTDQHGFFLKGSSKF